MYPNATHYSEHATRKELDCHCGCKTPPEVERELVLTAHAFEQLRIFHGNTPLSISNGYRCATQNASVGGKPNSAHMRGLALDVTAPAPTAQAVDHLAAKAEGVAAFHAGGIGRYYNEHGFFVHCDRWTDPACRPSRWDEH